MAVLLHLPILSTVDDVIFSAIVDRTTDDTRFVQVVYVHIFVNQEFS